MQSKTSFFSVAIFKKNLSRYWPVWGGYTVLLFLGCPIMLFRLLSDYISWNNYLPSDLIPDVNTYVYGFFVQGGTVVSFAIAMVAAAASFSYLFHLRSTSMYHALPYKKDGLFLTNYLSGLAFVTIPVLITGIGALAVEVFFGCVDFGLLAAGIGIMLMSNVFFYSFAVFCMMFTGMGPAGVFFYLIFNFLAPFLETIISSFLGTFVFGYVGESLWLTGPLCPLYYLLEDSVVSFYNYSTIYVTPWASIGAVAVRYVVFMVVGLIFAAGSLFLYRIRRAESAGDIITFRPVRPVFKFSVAFCFALLTTPILMLMFHSGVTSHDIGYILLYVVITGFVGYFAAEMLIRKSFKVFKTGIKGYLAFALAMAILLLGAEFDLVGYERRVPADDSIEMVFVGGYYDTYADALIRRDRDAERSLEHNLSPDYVDKMQTSAERLLSDSLIDYLYAMCENVYKEPENIRRITELHRYILENKATMEREPDYSAYEDFDFSGFTDDDWDDYRNRYSRESLIFLYRLKSGKVVERRYYYYPSSFKMEGIRSPDEILAEIRSTEEGRLKLMQAHHFGPEDVSRAYLSTYNSYDGSEAQIELLQSAEFFDAALGDLLAGRIGNNGDLSGDAFNSRIFTTSIVFEFSRGATHPAFVTTSEEDYGYPYYYSRFTIPVTVNLPLEAGSEGVIALLQSYGYLDNLELITWGEAEINPKTSDGYWDGNYYYDDPYYQDLYPEVLPLPYYEEDLDELE